MTNITPYICPVCGGRLCVDEQYPDHFYCETCGRIYCDTRENEEPPCA